MLQSGCVMVFITGVLLPVKATFLHAALRLRNIKNKVTIVTCLNEDNMEMEQSGLYYYTSLMYRGSYCFEMSHYELFLKFLSSFLRTLNIHNH